VADLVEFVPGPDGERPFPIEIKRGKPKLHRADEGQFCAQALCLEEMFGRLVPDGALFYGETRCRAEVQFDADLRGETEVTIARLTEVFRSEETPPAVYSGRLCRACSLVDLCRPKLCGRSVARWRMRALGGLLEGSPVQ
jgi:CRISPR-associated exonuclease Cas4